ncbi:MAG: UDP-N-acetylglucosamine--N-acetylmuramyl-(pentapeptide) pyrophosphoryl-undecaprenol N-acetylglucosamine transferase [Anaerolineae bacterium]|nr:UDP-N-acetylglucosamine--N-acetylmuramyl-(pentapeptide) pyrophosphoryl-undecaprenol N-acetylglucosamine transferase [Anaerolineae bacterium]
MKLLVSAGGTGGGIYPALAVVATLRTIEPDAFLHFVGSQDGLENDLIHAAQVRFNRYDRVQAGPLHGVSPLRAASSLLKLMVGTLQALQLFARQRPDAVFLTGGWVGLPVALAAQVYRVPVAIFVPDIEPGLTLKVLGRFARLITATTADTQAFFPNKPVLETGYPLRPELMRATREEGQAAFALDPELPTLLVFGGSRGARSINQAVWPAWGTCWRKTRCRWCMFRASWIGKRCRPGTPACRPICRCATTSTPTCTTWAPPWLRRTWCCAALGRPPWASYRIFTYRPSWCPIRMPGAIRRSMQSG